MSVCLCVCVSVCLSACVPLLCLCVVTRVKRTEGLETTPKPFGNVVLPNGQFQCTVKTRQLGAKAARYIRLNIEAGNGTGNNY